MLIDWLDNDYASSLAFALADEAKRRDVRLVCFVGHGLMAVDAAPQGSNIAFALASARALDALIVVSLGTALPVAERIRYLERYRPLPLCTYTLESPALASVAVDSALGMRNAVSHLIQFHERRRIAFVRGPEHDSDAEARYQGYRTALDDFGLSYDARLEVAGDFSRAAGRAAVRCLLDQRRAAFDALVAANDQMAAAAEQELLARGVSVPDDVALSGFDDVEESRFADVPITSVRQPFAAQARRALDLVLAALEGKSAAPTPKLSPELVPRRSCGCEVVLEGAARGLRPRARGDAGPSAAAAELERSARLARGMQAILERHGLVLETRALLALVERFLAGLDGDGAAFLAALEGELGRGSREAPGLSGWYHALAFLRREGLASCAGDRAARLAGEQLVHAAFEGVSYAAERQQALRRLEVERLGRVLTSTTEALVTGLDARRVAAALAERLPELGLESFAIAEYIEDGAPVPARSRVLLAHDVRRSVSALSGSVFDTLELAPAALWPTDRAGAFVLEPLYFQDERLGFALFEVGPRQGAIYLTLREQLAAALTGRRLLARIAAEARQRGEAERARASQEVQIARRFRAASSPRALGAEGLDLAARVVPGGSGAAYCDVRCRDGRVWWALGRVEGEDLGASLLVPLLGSVVATLWRSLPEARPEEILHVARSVIREQVRDRLGQRERVELLVARHQGGRIDLAGDFAGVRLQRAHAPRAEVPARSASGSTYLARVELDVGDLLVLHTAAAELESAPLWSLEQQASAPAERVCEALAEAFDATLARPRPELALAVIRRVGRSERGRS